MEHKTPILLGVVIIALLSSLQADVLLDDFGDHFDANPDQCHLGEAYGYATFGDSGVDSGGGFWAIFIDTLGTQVTNGQGVPIDTNGNNLATLIEDGAMHAFFKTHLSSADFIDEWPYAGLWCGLLGEDSTYFDFTNLTTVNIRLKGSGRVRILFETKDVYEMVDANGDPVGWGYYGVDKILSPEWEDCSLNVQLFLPEAYSPAADSGWRWNPDSLHPEGGCKNVCSFVVQAIPDEDTATKDSAELWIDDIVLKGLDYKATFGFDFDTLIDPIIYTGRIPKHAHTIQISSNPYTQTLTLSYTLEKADNVYISLVDTKGKIIADLAHGRQIKGRHTISTPLTTKMANGIYFVSCRINNAVVTRKFSFIK